ncbi:MAG: bifunctional serine/threonine-protein kinase/formylglycine-generating enzyme family protein [Polyangiaceae bacterium]
MPALTAPSATPPTAPPAPELRDLLARLPTPLAQLARRILNARPGVEHHGAAFYFAEASLKLAAGARLSRLLARREWLEPELAQKLEAIVLPSVGHWCSFLAESSRVLAVKAGDTPLGAASKEMGKPLASSSATAAFIDAVREADLITDETAKRSKKAGTLGFYDVLASYRNQVMGHGALRSAAFYERFAVILRRAALEAVLSPSYLGGRQLAVPWVDEQADAPPTLRWKVLEGLAGIVASEAPAASVASMPTLAPPARAPEDRSPSLASLDPRRLRSTLPSSGEREIHLLDDPPVSLHPLVIFDEDEHGRERFGFINRAALNKKGSVKRADYLDYATGDELKGHDATAAVTGLLERIRGKQVTQAEVEAVATTIAASPLSPEEGASSAPPAGLLGRVLGGKYRLVAQLGEGGMASVYEAQNVELARRTYAVKILDRQLAKQPDLLERFRREADEMSALRHRGIVDVSDFGREPDGTVFLVMERLRGRTLDRYVEEGHPPLEQIVRLFCEALDALGQAHARGLVHRDLKPANLFVSEEPGSPPTIKILDFGIAKVLGAERGATHEGMILGTPRFMSPEQVVDSSSVDPRADLYSLGVTLYQVLTGVPPVDGESLVDIVFKVGNGLVDRHPRARAPQVPEWLDAVVAKAMSARREERFTNADEMRQALANGLATSATVHAPEPSAPPPSGGAPDETERPLVHDPPVAPPKVDPTEPIVMRPTGAKRGLVFGGVALGIVGAVIAIGVLRSRDPRETAPTSSAASTPSAPSSSAPSSRPPVAATSVLAPLSPNPSPPSGMRFIGGQTFTIGTTEAQAGELLAACGADEKCREKVARETPAHAVVVASFFLDEVEVSAAEYAAWLGRVDGLTVATWGEGEARGLYVLQKGEPLLELDTRYSVVMHHKRADGGFAFAAAQARAASTPVNYVTWTGADKFCRARGARLPTEAEWELAARGVEGRVYPWGDAEPTCQTAIYGRGEGVTPSCGAPGPGPARAYADKTRDGIFDLGGNLREWTITPFRAYAACSSPCVDSAEVPASNAEEHVIRGGSWISKGPSELRAARRSFDLVTWADVGVGFRCAMPAPPKPPTGVTTQ